jgi:hypothetical protein
MSVSLGERPSRIALRIGVAFSSPLSKSSEAYSFIALRVMTGGSILYLLL